MIAGPLPNWEESFRIKLHTWTEQWRPGINQNQVSCKPMPQKQGTTILSSTTSLDTCLWCVPPGCFHSPPKPLWAWILLIGQTWVTCLYPSGKRLRSMHSLPFTKSYNIRIPKTWRGAQLLDCPRWGKEMKNVYYSPILSIWWRKRRL